MFFKRAIVFSSNKGKALWFVITRRLERKVTMKRLCTEVLSQGHMTPMCVDLHRNQAGTSQMSRDTNHNEMLQAWQPSSGAHAKGLVLLKRRVSAESKYLLESSEPFSEPVLPLKQPARHLVRRTPLRTFSKALSRTLLRNPLRRPCCRLSPLVCTQDFQDWAGYSDFFLHAFLQIFHFL